MGWATRQQVAFSAATRHLGGVSITAGAVSGMGMLDMPGEALLDGMVINTNFQLTCRTSEFGDLGYGAPITVDGEAYIVHEAPMLMGDGAFCRLSLERVSDAPPWTPGPESIEIEINGDLP